MTPIYRYQYPPYPPYQTDTYIDIPHILHTEPIPIHTDFFHTDTDTGYWYLVQVPGIGQTLEPIAILTPGIGIKQSTRICMGDICVGEISRLFN